MNKKFIRREKMLNARMNKFFETSISIRQEFDKFDKAFEHLKHTINDIDIYILDSMSVYAKEQFKTLYSYGLIGSGNYYSKKYCNDNLYRREYRFNNSSLILFVS